MASALLALDPTLTFVQVRDILRSTADDQVGPPSEDLPGRDDAYGWGRINMERGLASLGLVSRDSVHVAGLVLRRVDPGRLEIRVAVVDDLTGAEEGVNVEGALVLPDSTEVPLAGTTASNGVTILEYKPGPVLPAGAFTFRVDGVSKPGFVHDVGSDLETERTHDPDLSGIHVAAIDLADDGDVLTIDVRVADDDDRFEGGVLVEGRLDLPGGGTVPMTGTTARAAAGAVRFVHAQRWPAASQRLARRLPSLNPRSTPRESTRVWT